MAILKDIFGKTLIDDPTVEDFRGYDFTGRNLEYADFSNMDLSNADFTDANVEYSNFGLCDLFDCLFLNTDCRHADFSLALNCSLASFFCADVGDTVLEHKSTAF